MRDEDHRRSILPLSSDRGPTGTPDELPPIPSGIEQLLAMAAVDDRFARALRRDRGSAVRASGVDLNETEAGILGSVDDAALARMAANIGATMPEQDRRAFLGRSAAALVALVGASVTASCQCPGTVVKGVRPDRPQEPGQQPEPAGESTEPETGPGPASAPTRGIGGLTTKVRPSRPMPTKGIRPKRPLVGPRRPRDPLD